MVPGRGGDATVSGHFTLISLSRLCLKTSRAGSRKLESSRVEQQRGGILASELIFSRNLLKLMIHGLDIFPHQRRRGPKQALHGPSLRCQSNAVFCPHVLQHLTF